MALINSISRGPSKRSSRRSRLEVFVDEDEFEGRRRLSHRRQEPRLRHTGEGE